MGDCRLRILISNDLLPESSISRNPDTDGWHSITHVASADATVRDAVDAVLMPLWNQPLPEDACLWDCTLHPPKDISEWPLSLYHETSGPNSKTLYDAGWYPSGTWQILPKGKAPIQTQNYDDIQYNLQSQETLPSSAVRLNENDSMLPSQVLHSVTERFPSNEDSNEHANDAMEVRRQKKKERLAKEAERHAKLEERIRRLESPKKNQAVSQQVRRMLIKSRCTGSSSLKMHDRIYLHVIVVDGEDTQDLFRYFSQLDTVARIVSALANVTLPREAELLVRRNEKSEAVYRRLPIAMRLYEAIAQHFLQEVDSVVIRCFTPPEDEPTTSILETYQLQTDDKDMETEMKAEELANGEEKVLSSDDAAIKKMESDGIDALVQDRMNKAIATMDEAASSKSKKKASSTSAKVRMMLMKSKAKGDAKRVPKMDDRFFLDLVVVDDIDGNCSASASPVFLAKSDPVGRLLRDCVSVPNGCEVTILAVGDKGGFRKVPDDISLQDAEAGGFFKSFDRAVIRLYKNP